MTKKIFTTKNIAGMAVFAALSYAVSFLEFPLFPAAGFLKLDFSAVFILLGGFMYGPLSGIMISAIKELLRFITSSTGGIGELANFIVCVSFIIVPTVVYCYKKGIITVVITLFIGIFLQAAAALICNRYIMFPLYMAGGAKAAFESLWTYVLFFNLIKGAVISAIVFLLYKRISYLFKKINLQSAAGDDIIETENELNHNDNIKEIVLKCNHCGSVSTYKENEIPVCKYCGNIIEVNK